MATFQVFMLVAVVMTATQQVYGGGFGGVGGSGGYFTNQQGGGGQVDYGAGSHGYVDYVAYPKYDFAYGVADHYTGDFKSQKESRDDHHVVGEYELKEPGGNVRTVKYEADNKGGFFAHVINNGGNDHSGAHGHGHAHSFAHFHGPVVGPAHPVYVHGGGHGGYGTY